MADQYHEPVSELSNQDRDFVRALNSLKEEIEAIAWYHQRVAATKDETVKKILEHNRNEEMEHAAMLLEWLRRNMSGWDEALRTYLFTDKPITEIEEEESSGGSENSRGDLGIRKL
ncbi:encapsulin-associated ferritin-like protein [Thermotoga sp. KOL6]|uniref:encapsulin-associated ferritin-like protein n=1 Tax=Thermotoga sp. KOL6 TaxID=126741 RepID=UPI000C756CE1|nr:ferritin-like domain-containing protein [Thermotoga sp. KOL6]PLV59481.1 ferritin [Thermotoga sp. KOL6]